MPDLHRALAASTPHSEIVTHRQPSNLRRHYERLKKLPERLLVLGDAVASFNPVYGQGMSVAIGEAEALDAELSRGALRHGLGRAFQRRIAPIVDGPWQVATGEDLLFEQTPGRRTLGSALLGWYGRQVFLASASDLATAHALSRVMHMLDAPPRLLRPAVAARVLGSALRERRAPSGPFWKPRTWA